MKSVLLSVVPALLISACSLAAASNLDGNDDLHCSVISFYIARSLQPESYAQARSAFIMHAWYNKRINHKPDLTKAGPILKTVKNNFPAAKTAALACVERAARDPDFEPFAREAAETWDRGAAEGAGSGD